LQGFAAGLSVGQQTDCNLQVLSALRESRYAPSIMAHTGFLFAVNECRQDKALIKSRQRETFNSECIKRHGINRVATC
jgi:hypothetical protein